MVKALGVVFIAILIALPIIAADYFSGSNFLYKFAVEQSMILIATVLALNVAIVTFLVGHLLTIESKKKETLFKKTRNELRDNVYLMVCIFILNFLLVALNKPNTHWHFRKESLDVTFLLSSATAILTTLLVVALFEIIEVVFEVTNFIKDEAKSGQA